MIFTKIGGISTKFSILYQDTPAVKDYYEKHKGPAYGNGADLKDIRHLKTSEGRSCLAFCCEGDQDSYDWHKHYIRGATVLEGWPDE